MGSIWMFLAEVASLGAIFVVVGGLLGYVLSKTVHPDSNVSSPRPEPIAASEETP